MTTPATTATYTLLLAKEDFKFSAAHFTVFAPGEAERLHGHNYQVEVNLEGQELDEEGLLADLVAVKRGIRALCAHLDSRTLVPEDGRRVTAEIHQDTVIVRFEEREYRLPEADVVFLPMPNTTIELLARWFWHELRDRVAMPRVEAMTVAVGETAGQACTYRRPLR